MPMDDYDYNNAYRIYATLNVNAFDEEKINKNKIEKFIEDNNLQNDSYFIDNILVNIDKIRLLFSSYFINNRQITSIGLRFCTNFNAELSSSSKLWIVVNVFYHHISL